MSHARPSLLFAIIFAPVIAGCGTAASKSADRSIQGQRATGSARLTRAVFAMASLGLHTAPDLGGTKAIMKSIPKSFIGRTRGTASDFDARADLYFAVERSADQSGRLNLYADAGHQINAGDFTWPAPAWSGGQFGSFPAVVSSTFRITASTRKGTHGSLDFNVADSSGLNGTMHIKLWNAQGDYAEADLIVTDGEIHGKQHGHLACDNGIAIAILPGESQPWSYEETDEPKDDGGMDSTMTFFDSSVETLIFDAEGVATQDYVDSTGSDILSGDLSSNGVESIDYSNGSWEDVDVDTNTTIDSGSSTDSSNKAVRHRTRAAARLRLFAKPATGR